MESSPDGDAAGWARKGRSRTSARFAVSRRHGHDFTDKAKQAG